MSKKNLKFTAALRTDITDGNYMDSVLGHLSEAELTNPQLMETLAQMADAAAERKDNETKIVADSIKGVEELTGSASFEINRAKSLRNLAGRFRELRG